MKICAELVGASAPFVEGLVAALGSHNVLWYSRQPSAPSPVQAGVRYVDEAAARTVTVLDAPSLLAAGQGACGSISAAQFGWLRANGKPAWLLTTRRGSVWHVVVRTDAGLWDPTILTHTPRRPPVAGLRRKGPTRYGMRGNVGTLDIGGQ